MQFKEAEAFVFRKLKEELPTYLTYHNIDHTKDVVDSASTIATAEGINERERLLLLTAALFHDTGFIRGPKDHEEYSCSVARENLPLFGYSAEDIEEICRIIMATKLPQSPSDLLTSIICDADLDYLGRDDFFRISQDLYRELVTSNAVKSQEEWDLQQISFLGNHHYFTNTAIKKRQPKKEENLQILKSKNSIHLNEK